MAATPAPTAPSSRVPARGWSAAATARPRSSAGAAAIEDRKRRARRRGHGRGDGPRAGQCATANQLPRGRLEVPERLHPRAPHESRRPRARYYMSVHAAEPALDWSLAPPVPARSPGARAVVLRSVSFTSDALSPPAGLRVPVVPRMPTRPAPADVPFLPPRPFAVVVPGTRAGTTGSSRTSTARVCRVWTTPPKLGSRRI